MEGELGFWKLPEARPGRRRHLPAACLLLAAVVSVLALVQDWTVIHPGWADQQGPFRGLRLDFIGDVGVIALCLAAAAALRSPGSALTRVGAFAGGFLLLLGEAAAFIDMRATALFFHDPLRLLPGYYLGWVGVGCGVVANAACWWVAVRDG